MKTSGNPHQLLLPRLRRRDGRQASNAFAIFLGHKLLERIPMKWARACSGLLFLAFGIGIIWAD